MVCLVYLNFVNSLLEGSSSGPKLEIVEAFLQRFIPAQNWGITSQGPLQPFLGLVSTQEFQVTPLHLWAGESTLGWEDLQSHIVEGAFKNVRNCYSYVCKQSIVICPLTTTIIHMPFTYKIPSQTFLRSFNAFTASGSKSMIL